MSDQRKVLVIIASTCDCDQIKRECLIDGDG